MAVTREAEVRRQIARMTPPPRRPGARDDDDEWDPAMGHEREDEEMAEAWEGEPPTHEEAELERELLPFGDG